MNEYTYNYDEESDTFSISFLPVEKTTGVEITDHIILSIHKPTRRIVRITLLDYSLLVQQTEFGPRTFPLTGLAAVSEDVREIILDGLRTSPVRDILRVAAYTPKDSQVIPVILVQPVMAVSEAP